MASYFRFFFFFRHLPALFRDTRPMYVCEGYETLSPCMMDILSMQTAPLPVSLTGPPDRDRQKKNLE